jgi:hypothetical protein
MLGAASTRVYAADRGLGNKVRQGEGPSSKELEDLIEKILEIK